METTKKRVDWAVPSGGSGPGETSRKETLGTGTFTTGEKRLVCPVCGGPVPEGRNRRYCSDRCKSRAYYLRSLGTPVPVAPDEPLANWPGTTIPMRVSLIEAFARWRHNPSDAGEPLGGES